MPNHQGSDLLNEDVDGQIFQKVPRSGFRYHRSEHSGNTISSIIQRKERKHK